MKIKTTYRRKHDQFLTSEKHTIPCTIRVWGNSILIEEDKNFEKEIIEEVINTLAEHKESLVQAALKIWPMEEIELCSQTFGNCHKFWVQRRQL